MGVSHYHLCLAGSREVGKLYVVKRQGFRNALIGSCWPEGRGVELTREAISCDWFGEHMYLSVFGPELKWRWD